MASWSSGYDNFAPAKLESTWQASKEWWASVPTDFTQQSSWWNEVLFRRAWPDEACSELWQSFSREDKLLGSHKKDTWLYGYWIGTSLHFPQKCLDLSTEESFSLTVSKEPDNTAWGKIWKVFFCHSALSHYISWIWLGPRAQNDSFTTFWLFHICDNRNQHPIRPH